VTPDGTGDTRRQDVTRDGRTTPDQSPLREVVEAVVTAAGYDLEDLTVVAAGRRRLLKVILDSDDGVDLDEAAQVSRDISERLDALEAADPMGAAAYTLEVTSPGIGRPLTMPRHFRRAVGRMLAIITTDGSTVLGRVLAAQDDGVDLLVGKAGLDPRRLTYDEIDKARVEVEFNPPSAQVLALLGEQTAQKFSNSERIEDET
jgi:ribosome maturation factor RimP